MSKREFTFSVRRSSAIARVLILVMLISCNACTTMRQIEEPTAVAQSVEVGDVVSVIDTDGRVSEFKVGKVNDSVLADTAEAGSFHSIEVEDIAEVKVARIDPGKSILTGVGTVVLLPFYLLGLMICAHGKRAHQM